MKNLFLCLLFIPIFFSCDKEESCIDTNWVERNAFNASLHREWAGEFRITADSVMVIVDINDTRVFEDTMYNQTKIFSVEKWDNYQVGFRQLSGVSSYELNLEERSQDCSNRL